MSDRELTEKQKKFLEVLFEEASGDLKQAKYLAGYSKQTRLSEVTDGLEAEIYEQTKKYISKVGTKAAYAIGSVVDDPTQLGAKDRMAAAKDILDRAGFKPADKVEVEAKDPLFILPAKKNDKDEEEEV